MKALALLATILGLVLLAQPSAATQEPGLSISGTIWTDVNGDGIRQPEDFGRRFFFVRLMSADGSSEVARTFTDDTGSGLYGFGNVAPGSYRVVVRSQIITFPLRATDELAVSVSLSTGSLSNLDFGVRAADQMQISGLAWRDAAFVPTPQVRAFVDQTDCTRSELLPPDLPSAAYSVIVLSSELKAGCGSQGKTVYFTVNGLVANESVAWNAPLGGGLSNQLLDLTIGGRFAYYVFRGPISDGVTPGLDPVAQPVRALIAGKDCARLFPGVFDIFYIVVPSREQVSGCGVEGVVVTFAIGDVILGEATWTPGRHDGPAIPWPLPSTSGTIRPPSAGDGALLRR